MKESYRVIALFFLTWIVLCAIVCIFPYEYYDSDSSCYSSISQKLAREPLRTWCAPQWWGHGGNQGLFRDHPPGIFWLPAFLVRAGVKGPAAALCANFLYILLTLYFVFKLVERHGSRASGWAAVFAFVLTPIFIQYLVRANQEHPLNLAVMAGLYGLGKSGEGLRYKLLFVLALTLAFFVKGLSALNLTFLSLVYAALVLRTKKSFAMIGLSHLAVLGAVGAFELWYRSAVHAGFLQAYISFQGGRSVGVLLHPLRKAYNLGWYASRALWFSFPWGLGVFAGLWRSGKEHFNLFKDRFLQFLLAGSAVIMLFFSMSDRKADRYIFPAYFLLAMAGALLWVRVKPRILDFMQKKEKSLPLYLSLVLIVLGFLRVFFHSHFYRFLRFWPD